MYFVGNLSFISLFAILLCFCISSFLFSGVKDSSCDRGCWIKRSCYFQVSRSIGDVYLKKPEFNRDPMYQQFLNPVPMKRPVVSAEPSILIRNIKPQDMFLIFASDGLWEQLTDEAAVEIVFKNPRAVSSHTSTRIAFFFLFCFSGKIPICYSK